MRAGTRWTRLATAAMTIVAVGPAAAAADPGADRAIGDTRVLARVPADPGYPEGIAVQGASVYVTGPAALGTTGKKPSYVRRYRIATGELLRHYDLQGEDLQAEHASSALAFDAQERIYVLGTQFGVVRIDETTERQTAYAPPLPDIPPCGSLPADAPCSPTAGDRPPLPNDMAFDGNGHLFITDSFQATIWRVPPGGGAPQQWYASAALDVSGFGPNGIRFDRTGRRLLVSMTGPEKAGVYSLSVEPSGAPGEWRLLHAYGPDDGPDGFSVASSGRLLVSLAFANQLSILEEDGTEVLRFPDAATNTQREVPYSNPSGSALAGDGAAMVANHGIFDPLGPQRFAVLDVWVALRPLQPFRPAVP